MKTQTVQKPVSLRSRIGVLLLRALFAPFWMLGHLFLIFWMWLAPVSPQEHLSPSAQDRRS